jgi:probable rRNA maturation factor
MSYENSKNLDFPIEKFLKKVNLILRKEKKFKKILLKHNLPLVFIIKPNLMRQMEKKLLDKDKEADILSFKWPQNFPYENNKKPPLGEIYLNKKILKNKDKTKHLLVHGFLHLLGFTHFKKNDSIKMEQKEKEILSRLIKF